MKLSITTPEAVLLERDGVVALRAQDESGGFGILPGHAPFLTVLTASVLSWRGADGSQGHAALRGGTLAVRAGDSIQVATREAVLSDDVAQLAQRVASYLAEAATRESSERVAAAQLQAAAIRRLIGLMRQGEAMA